ncbi:Proteasome subunit alpha 1 [Apophysomyces sp. BC1034]|nr:Proteasome subunit alpha 1 [Apophysomyces sp. BC1015]KAG0171714.1 Proteasome subunit alpha 1 [Apophysomyces sp. BC1021]KAG0184947.1 Proteasome subunit alpha 1 [Apophysomyces sp. BC1034]
MEERKSLKHLANSVQYSVDMMVEFVAEFRNQYDNDVSTWSPQGRIHQVEYAVEAVKQGSAAIGLRNKDYAVLLALKRSSGELASYQKKLIKIDEHMGIGIAGLTSDARVLSNFMRTEAMKSKMLYDRPLPVQRIVTAIADKAQVNTQQYGRRPYGVGLLVIGYDETGPHLYECSPSGTSFEYHAMSIGARSQSAKTYLESHYQDFVEAPLDDLVRHGLQALRDTLQQDKELNIHNTSLGIVGKDKDFQIIEGEALQQYLDLLGTETGRTRRGGAVTASQSVAADETVPAPDVAPMDTDA